MKEKTYSYDAAFEAALQYFKGDELAARVWVNKYSMKDSYGHIYEVSPEDMHWRIANEIARIENKYENPLKAEEIFGLLDHFKYIIPAGSPMTGIGNNHQIASLSNCFVIGLDGQADSYGGIIRIEGIRSTTTLRLYNLQGTLLHQSEASGDTQISTSGLRGVYILQAGRKTQKLMLR